MLIIQEGGTNPLLHECACPLLTHVQRAHFDCLLTSVNSGPTSTGPGVPASAPLLMQTYTVKEVFVNMFVGYVQLL